MEDKKVLEFINKNYNENRKQFIKSQKKKHKKEIIRFIIYILAILSVIWVFINTIDLETRKAVKNCLKNGYSENYCLRSK